MYRSNKVVSREVIGYVWNIEDASSSLVYLTKTSSGLIGKPPHLGCGHHVGSSPAYSTKGLLVKWLSYLPVTQK